MGIKKSIILLAVVAILTIAGLLELQITSSRKPPFTSRPSLFDVAAMVEPTKIAATKSTSITAPSLIESSVDIAVTTA